MSETLFGMNIIVSPLVQPVPVLQIDPKFKWCSDEFRAKHNAWLLARFGTVEVAYVINGGKIAISPQYAEKLRTARKSQIHA